MLIFVICYPGTYLFKFVVNLLMSILFPDSYSHELKNVLNKIECTQINLMNVPFKGREFMTPRLDETQMLSTYYAYVTFDTTRRIHK